MKKFRVINDRVLVKQDAKIETSHLMIPDKVRKPPTTGVVLSIGQDVNYVKVGDRIAYHKYAGHFLEFSQDLTESDLIVMREDEVLAIEDDEVETS